jgi:hypothetical protein
LHVFPAIEVGFTEIGETSMGEGRVTSGSDIATGNIPVNAAAPTEIA